MLFIAAAIVYEFQFWGALGICFLAGLFLTRIFIIQHDCGHNSFIKSKKASDIIGYACSVFSFLPFKYWAETHTFHHGHNGQLETRQIGDMPTLTVEEFRAKKLVGTIQIQSF